MVKLDPDLEVGLFQAWKPTEGALAQLLEDAGGDRAPVVLALTQDQPNARKLLDRLLMLSDELGTIAHVSSSDPWERRMRALGIDRETE